MKGFQMRPFHTILLVLVVLGVLSWAGMRWFVLQMVLPDFVTSAIHLARQQMQIGKPESVRQGEETLKAALKQSDLESDPKKPLKQAVLKEYVDFLNKQHREKEAEPLSLELARLQARQ